MTAVGATVSFRRSAGTTRFFAIGYGVRRVNCRAGQRERPEGLDTRLEATTLKVTSYMPRAWLLFHSSAGANWHGL